MIPELVNSQAVTDMAIALLHTLWQGLVLAVILFAGLKRIPSNRSVLRYRLGVLSLLAIVVCWMGTFSILQYEPEAAESQPAEIVVDSTVVREAGEITQQQRFHSAQNTTIADSPNISFEPKHFGWPEWFMIAWSIGVMVMLGRIFSALAGTAKLRHDATDITDDALTELFEKLCAKMHIKQTIRFATSSLLTHPGVIGFFKPIMLIPVSILSEVSTEDLQAIIAHELAHIRRYDYLVNFCQMVIEAIFFFNPMVWWISRRIRIEREACCDIAGVETTGKPARYAQTLLDQLCRAAGSSGQVAAAITGFSDDNESTSTERIKRIIHPQRKPQMKIGWIKLTCWMFIATFSLVTLWKTTDITIAFAGSILSPAERIEIMAELDKTHGIPEYDPEGSDEISEDEKVTVAGTIKTWDGGKIDRHAHMKIKQSNGGSSATISISVSFDEQVREGNTGHFSHKCKPGVVYVTGSSPGYAPACAGPFELETGQIKDDIEIILQEGYPSSIQVVDAETKQPIPEAEISGWHHFAYNVFQGSISLKTDENGVAVVEHVATGTASLDVKKPGYQKKRFEKQRLPEDGILVLEMEQAKLTEGIVVSKETGLPVLGAIIRIQKRMGENAQDWGRNHSEILVRSDEQGRFTLDQLNELSTYIFCVKADGYAYAYTGEITAGQEIRIQLQNEIVIKGRAEGDLDKLPVRDGKLYVPYKCTYIYNHSSHTERTQRAFVTVQDDQAFFELTDLWGTHVKVGSDDWKQTIEINHSIPDEVVLDLSQPLTVNGKPYHKRDLILEFGTPEGFPPPTGTVRLNYKDPAYVNNGYKPKLAEIVDGKVQVEIIAPGELLYEMGDTVGYWFKGSSAIKVDDAAEPLVINVPAIPAGMIFGQVYEADGTPATNTLVSFIHVKPSPLLEENTHHLDVDGKNSASGSELRTKYSISPLPLEGIYRPVAHRGHTYVLGERIKLTEKNPIQEVNLTLPEGMTVSGHLFMPDGQPANNVACELSFSPSDGHGFGTGPNYTNSRGQFEFYRVNPDIDGKYFLNIESKKDFRPVRLELEDIKLPIELTLEAGAVTSGQILDKETGWPIPGLEVSAGYTYEIKKGEYRYDRVVAENKTNQNGMFRFSNMMLGEKYGVSASGCKDLRTEVIAGQTEPVKIIAELYEWSQCKPRKPDEE